MGVYREKVYELLDRISKKVLEPSTATILANFDISNKDAKIYLNEWKKKTGFKRSNIEQYLYLIASVTSNTPQGDFYKWLIKNGELFNREDFMEVESQNLAVDVASEIKQCYSNSERAYWFNGLDYYIGFYFFRDIPIVIDHAFNVYNGKVYDSTAVLFNSLPIEWYGIKIDLSKLKDGEPLDLYNFYKNVNK